MMNEMNDTERGDRFASMWGEHLSLDDCFEHEVDEALARAVLNVNRRYLDEMDVWFCLPGQVVAGRLEAIGDWPEPGTPGWQRTRPALPLYAYLNDAQIYTGGGPNISVSLIRVKLADVAAWGVGRLTEGGEQ